VAGLEWYRCSRLKHNFSLLHGYHPNPVTPKLQHTSTTVLQPAKLIPPQPSHTETPTRKHNCASACYTDTTPTQPHRNSNTQTQLCFSLLHGCHPNPATPKLQHTNTTVLQPATRMPPQTSHTETPTHKHNCASACYTDATPTQPHRNSNTQAQLQPATRIPPQPNHTETPTHIETR